MNRIVLGVILIAVMLALAIFIHYQMLDRRKFMAAAHYMNYLDDSLSDWLAAAQRVGTLADTDDGSLEQLRDCAQRYDCTRSTKTEQKTLIVNEAYRLLCSVVARMSQSAELDEWRAQMNENLDGFLDSVNEYNFYVLMYNKKLETRVGSLIADLLHLKHMTVVENLHI